MRHRPEPNARLYETRPRPGGLVGSGLAAFCGWLGIVSRIQHAAPGATLRISLIAAVACAGFALVGAFLMLFGPFVRGS